MLKKNGDIRKKKQNRKTYGKMYSRKREWSAVSNMDTKSS